MSHDDFQADGYWAEEVLVGSMLSAGYFLVTGVLHYHYAEIDAIKKKK